MENLSLDFYQNNIALRTCYLRSPDYTNVCEFRIWLSDAVTAVPD